MKTGMMGMEMETKESIRQGSMTTETNRVLMGEEYLGEEMAPVIKAAPKEESMNARDVFRRDPGVNIIIARAGDVAPRRRQYVGSGESA
jgi:hypothetical protein